MNYKKILCLSFAFILAMSVCAGAKTLEFTMGANKMYESADSISGHTLENAPYTKNDRTMVPVRIISERFGAEVGWNSETSEITIKKDGKIIVLTLGKTEAYVNGEAITLDVAPEEFNGRTMIPVRFVSEVLGMDVDYVAATEQVIISDEEAVMTVNDIKITKDDYKSIIAYIGFDPEIDDVKEYVNYLNTSFKEIYAVAAYIKSTGYTYKGIYGNSIKESIDPNKDAIYQKALTSPVAKLLENDLYAAEIVSDYADSEAIIARIQDIYTKEYITAKHILIATEERSDAEAKKLAESVLKKINSGDDFDALIKEYGEDPGTEQNPDGYTFTKGEMVKEFESAAFALEEGKVSGLVKSPYGYHIIKREPLADMDYYNAYAITEMATDEFYRSVVQYSLDNVKITMHKTDDEIAEFLK